MHVRAVLQRLLQHINRSLEIAEHSSESIGP